ncbi:MAG: hypothetical protein WCF23_13340 [Candidatus Nitrosopolaris sp.]
MSARWGRRTTSVVAISLSEVAGHFALTSRHNSATFFLTIIHLHKKATVGFTVNILHCTQENNLPRAVVVLIVLKIFKSNYMSIKLERE